MRLKNLVPLVAILVILLVLVVLKQAQERPAPVEEAVQLEPLIPADLSRADLQRLVLFAGPNPDEKVELVRAGDAGAWQVATRFDAPVDEDRISDYLDLLIDLKGELRQADVAEESLGQYTLTEDEAFHVIGYTDGDEPAFTLLVGKDAGPQNVFVRAAASDDVYVVNKNPRNEAGVWQDDLATAPDSATWVDKTVLDLEQDAIDRITLATPDRTLALAREVPLPEEPEDPAGDGPDPTKDAAESQAEAGDEPESAGEEAPEPVWTVAEGGPGTAFKQAGVDRLARTLASLTASDVVDPAQKAGYGLEPPMFTATIGLDNADEDITLRGGRTDATGDGYIEVAGRDRAVVYKLSKYTFEQVFALGNMSTLFEMPGLDVQQDALAKVAYPADDIEVTLAKDGETWAVVAPEAPLEPQTNTLSTVASSLASWRPTDYADALPEGVDPQWRTVTVTLADESTRTLQLGPESRALDGVYARAGDGGQLWVMRQSDVTRIAPPPNDLYQRSLFDITADDVTRVAIERDGDSLALERGENGWSLAGDPEAALDQARIDTLLTTLAGLQAETIRFGQTALDGEPSAVLRFTAAGAEQALRLAETGSETWNAALPDRGLVVTLRAIDVADLTPGPEALRAPDPEPVEPPAEAAEAAEPAEPHGHDHDRDHDHGDEPPAGDEVEPAPEEAS